MNGKDDEILNDPLAGVQPPTLKTDYHKTLFKLYLLRTKKAYLTGLFLIILPIVFAIGVISQYNFQTPVWPFSQIADWIISIDPDSDRSLISWCIRLLLMGGPFLAVILNLLSVMHLYVNRPGKELVISLKWKWHNWLIIILGTLVLLLFLGVLLAENIGHN